MTTLLRNSTHNRQVPALPSLHCGPVSTSTFPYGSNHNDFTFIKLIGQGNMGEVHLARYASTGHLYAIKSIPLPIVDNSNGLVKAPHPHPQQHDIGVKEARITGILKHPNIVRQYASFADLTHTYLVCEYVQGSPLPHRQYPLHIAKHILSQIVSAVAYLHHNHIAHRDLKPENILWTPGSNRVKLIDFGLADVCLERTLDLHCGSLCYAAPELLFNEGKYLGLPVDVWSLGVLMHLLVLGFTPFGDPQKDHHEVRAEIKNYDILSLPAWVDSGTRSLMQGMLEKIPAKRMTIWQVAKHPWFEGLVKVAVDPSNDIVTMPVSVTAVRELVDMGLGDENKIYEELMADHQRMGLVRVYNLTKQKKKLERSGKRQSLIQRQGSERLGRSASVNSSKLSRSGSERSTGTAAMRRSSVIARSRTPESSSSSAVSRRHSMISQSSSLGPTRFSTISITEGHHTTLLSTIDAKKQAFHEDKRFSYQLNIDKQNAPSNRIGLLADASLLQSGDSSYSNSRALHVDDPRARIFLPTGSRSVSPMSVASKPSVQSIHDKENRTPATPPLITTVYPPRYHKKPPVSDVAVVKHGSLLKSTGTKSSATEQEDGSGNVQTCVNRIQGLDAEAPAVPLTSVFRVCCRTPKPADQVRTELINGLRMKGLRVKEMKDGWTMGFEEAEVQVVKIQVVGLCGVHVRKGGRKIRRMVKEIGI